MSISLCQICVCVRCMLPLLVRCCTLCLLLRVDACEKHAAAAAAEANKRQTNDDDEEDHRVVLSCAHPICLLFHFLPHVSLCVRCRCCVAAAEVERRGVPESESSGVLLAIAIDSQQHASSEQRCRMCVTHSTGVEMGEEGRDVRGGGEA